jgi:LysR family cys regulon transcriptional activator
VLNAIDADVIKTYVEFGLGIAIVPSLAYDRRRDKNLRAIDASHLFEPNTIHVGIRRNHYLRGYLYAFIEFFAPQQLPELSTGRSNAEQIRRMYEHHKNPDWQTEFD